MSRHQQDSSSRRRRFLVAVTSSLGIAGVAATAIPFVASWRPSARARAVGAPVEIDVSKIEPGAQVTVKWRGRPVWVLRRTSEMLEHLTHSSLLERLRDPASDVPSQQPAYARNATRSIDPEYLVVMAVCTHLGCVPVFRPEVGPTDLGADWMGGYFCPCHGSAFDFAGRVYANVPAPTNLAVPPHRYLTPSLIEIGIDYG